MATEKVKIERLIMTHRANSHNYQSLFLVLQEAFLQAANGKGALRHGGKLPFEAQPMQVISDLLHTPDGLLFQAIKKIQESKRLDRQAARFELLGAINYLAGAVLWIDRNPEHGKSDNV